MHLFFLLLLVFNTPLISRHKEAFITSNEVLKFCRHSIVEITDDKIFLCVDRIEFFKDRFFLLNDFQDWVPIKDLQRDHRHGFFILMENPLCPFNHPGARRVKFTWFCLSRNCPFFLHNHFKDGCFCPNFSIFIPD